MLFFWILQMFLVKPYQASDLNCLRANPDVLDAGFTFVNNKYEQQKDVSQEDVIRHVSLFSSRFKRAHEFYVLFPKTFPSLLQVEMRFLGNALALYKNDLKENFQIFLTIRAPAEDQRINLTTAIAYYTEYYNTIIKINSGTHGSVVGLYVVPLVDTIEGDLKAIEFVFGSKENSTLPIGHSFTDCPQKFNDKFSRNLLERLNFITCWLHPLNKISPEESADEVIKTCDSLRDTAVSLNLTADIMCRVQYSSYGISVGGFVGSVSGFQKFWCRIVNEITRNTTHAKIIMWSAFNETPNDLITAGNTLTEIKYHIGWWRRRHATSYDVSAFVEKVEESDGGRERGNCSAECDFCNSAQDCCPTKICSKDVSFQPFEIGEPRFVCQSDSTKCVPRLPTVSKITPDGLAPREGASFANVLIISVFTFAAVLIVVVAWLKYHLKKTKHIFSQEELAKFFEGSHTRIIPSESSKDAHELVDDLPYDKSLEVRKSRFEIRDDKVLGTGAFGVVVEGRIGNENVAVKSTHPGVEKVHLKALILELKVLMYLGAHENIVNLRGAHTPQLNSGKLYLFFELCPFGDLLQFLRSHRTDFANGVDTKVNLEYTNVADPKENQEYSNFSDSEENSVLKIVPDPKILLDYQNCKDPKVYPDNRNSTKLTLERLLHWSVQIASAMEHLAKKRVIHGDIAARNILVFSVDTVKLTDFGLSRRLYEYSNYVKNNQEPLPWRHMSLEALRDLSFSVQSDVWSFGVTLWEIFSLGEVPYPGLSWSQDFVQNLTDGLRLRCPQHAQPFIYELMTSCWTEGIQSRPTIFEILSNLSTVLDTK